MPSEYVVFVWSGAVETYRLLPRLEKDVLERFFDLLENYPHLKGETTERDEMAARSK